ncbi:MAG: DNA polymerase III subunit delta, partial [Acetobacteraceae bacterium]
GTLLLVTAMNADYKTVKTAWAKALGKAGALVECKPVTAAKMPAWVASRLASCGVRAPAGAAALIAEYAQGNLLSATQAIERLSLASAGGEADMNAVREAVVDEARFDLFELVDAALAGDAAGALRILVRMRETGTAEPLVLWAIARELRTLEALAWAAEYGGPRPNIYPPNRRGLVANAAKRHDVRGWQALIGDAARLDRAIKGRASESAGVLAERLLLAIAGAEGAADKKAA